MTQEMCDIAIVTCPFVFEYTPDQYKIHKMCDEAVDYYLLTLKFAPDWLVTNRMLEKLDNFVFSSDGIIFNHVDYNIITFLSDNVDFNTIGLHNINFNNDNFDEEDPEVIIHVGLMDRPNRIKLCTTCKKSKELTYMAWQSTRWWDWCISEDE